MNKASRLSTQPSQRERDFLNEYEEMIRLAQADPSTIAHEWSKEGDNFKECTLYNDDRAVLITHTIPL